MGEVVHLDCYLVTLDKRIAKAKEKLHPYYKELGEHVLEKDCAEHAVGNTEEERKYAVLVWLYDLFDDYSELFGVSP